MSQRPTKSIRPNFVQLEQREAPASVVTSQADLRPLDFQITGTVHTTDIHPSNLAVGAATDTFTGNFTLTGRMNYDATGMSGNLAYTATGTGTSTYDPIKDTGANGTITVNYSASETGNISFHDTNNVWLTTNSFSRVSDRIEDFGIGNSRVVLGPSGVKLTFDPNTMTASGGWASQSGANATSGVLTGNMTQPGAGATDLSVKDVSLLHNADGYEVKFNVGVTGALMASPTGNAPASAAVFWTDGTGRSEAAGASVDVPWNAGKVSIDVTGLDAPTWATGVKVAVAANGWTETASTANNSSAKDLGSAVDPNAPAPPPVSTTPALSAVVGQSGPAVVNVFGSDGSLKFQLTPYGKDWTGGISTAVGDVNGDGVLDVITGAGNGGGPHVKVFNGKDGKEIASFYAYDPNFTGGVNVAAGDLDGDGKAEVITGAGVGGNPHVKVFDATTLAEKRSFYAFDLGTTLNGVSVAAGDLDGNGLAEIIVGAGVGSQPAVRVYGVGDAPVSTFFAYDARYSTGTAVGTKRLSDGRLVIATAVDPSYNLPSLNFDFNGNAVV